MLNPFAIFFTKKAKISLAIFIFFLLSIGFARMVIKNYYRPTARQFATLGHIQKVRTLQKIDYLIIGDSTGLHSLVPKQISPDTYSICVSGASLLDSYRILSQMDLSHVKKGIILSNSFNEQLHYGEDFWQRFVLTGTYSFSELQSIYDEGEQNNIFPVTKYSRFNFLSTAFLTRYFLNNTIVHALADYMRSGHWNTDYLQRYQKALNENNGYVSLEESSPNFKLSEERFFAHTKDYQYTFAMNRTDNYYLTKILHLAVQARLPLIMVSTPLVSGASIPSSAVYKSSFEKYFSEFAGQHPRSFALISVNMSLPRAYYFDFSHPRSEGANAITREFLRVLEEQNKTIVK